MKIKFSVVLPVFIGVDIFQIKRCLNSLYKQTVPPDEIVVVFDGRILEDVKSYILTFDKVPVVIVESVKVGVGAARSLGIIHSNFDFIAFMDADDYCALNRFEISIHALVSSDDYFCVVNGSIQEFDPLDLRLGSLREVPASNFRLLPRSPINNVTAFFNKELFFLVYGVPHISFGEDFIFWKRLEKAGIKFIGLKDVFVYVSTDLDLAKRRQSFRSKLPFLKVLFNERLVSSVGVLFLFLIYFFLSVLPLRFYRYLRKFIKFI